MTASTPLVSIGLPVHNGARYLRAAIDSVLAQTFSDFELIIADDASSDGTVEIARAYAAADPRVRFCPNERRLGLAENHNRVVELATGRHFHWMGADDAHDRRFLERCVKALEADTGCVLATTKLRMIDEQDRELGIEDNSMAGAASPQPAVRLAAALFDCPRSSAMYGLFRLDQLRRTSLMLPFHNSDRTLVVEAALCGRFVHVPEPLYFNREHAERYTAKPELWHSALQSISRPGRSALPLWRCFFSLHRAVGRLVPGLGGRLACHGQIGRWLLRWPNGLLLAWDLVAWLSPGFIARAWAWKRRLGLLNLLRVAPGDPEWVRSHHQGPSSPKP
jgi:glycosyltransferase involved in cell wall biosynthesis